MPTGGKKPTSASLGEVLEGLLEAGVDFILVGGLAAVIQGAPVTTMMWISFTVRILKISTDYLPFSELSMPFNAEWMTS